MRLRRRTVRYVDEAASPATPQARRFHRSGFTLVELIVSIVICTIAFLVAAGPFVAERSFWRQGETQTEAQRDAQLGLRVVARIGRGASSFDSTTNRFTVDCGQQWVARAGSLGEELVFADGCAGTTATLIDGVESRVTQLVYTAESSSVVRVLIEVENDTRGIEAYETRIYMRNAI